MGASFLTRWLQGLDPVEVFDEASIALVRGEVRRVGGASGLPPEAVESMALAATELASNQLRYANVGRVAVHQVERAGVLGIEVVAADRGPGLRGVGRALRGEGPGEGLRAGLSGVVRLSDEIDFDIRLEEGTCIRARRWRRPPAHPSEVAIIGAPYPGEIENGDDAGFVRTGEDLLVTVIDGLGHGAGAAEAAGLAAEVLTRDPALPPADLLAAAGVALRGTRGAVMAVARIEPSVRRLRHDCLGDVTTRIHTPSTTRTLPCRRGVVGDHRRASGKEAVISWEPGQILVMFTDGLVARAGLADAPLLLRSSPVLGAEHLFTSFRRGTDDALVLVAR